MRKQLQDILQRCGCKHAEIGSPKNLEHGDLSVALARDAKELQKSPAELGNLVIEAVRKEFPSIQCQMVGPFLNLKFPPQEFARFVLSTIHDPEYLKRDAIPGRVMVEFSQPNTHKEFHIGHLRNVCIGDALVRTLRAGGRDVIATNYFGDVGTHVAKCLWAYVKQGQPEAPVIGASKFFGDFYKQAYVAYDQDPAVKKEVGEILDAVEKRKEPWWSLWKKTRDLCLTDFHEIYKYLGVNFDTLFYESDCDEIGQKVVDEYLAKGVFKESEGAIICDLTDDKLGVCLVRKSDGTSLYATKDLALARLKFTNFQINESIYVVGSEQILHFKQVFKTLEKMGFPQAKSCKHLSYELVMLPQGKMSSRAGNAIGLDYVQKKVEAQVLEEFRSRNIPAEPITARRIVLSALKYGMVRQDPSKKIVFNLEEWLKFEGDTGPYLLYTYARMRSILRKVGEVKWENQVELTAEAEREFLHALLAYEKSFDYSVQTKQVNILADQAFKMAKAFNRFYLLCPVQGAPDDIKAARLNLLHAFTKIFRHCMECLNIELVDNM